MYYMNAPDEEAENAENEVEIDEDAFADCEEDEEDCEDEESEDEEDEEGK